MRYNYLLISVFLFESLWAYNPFAVLPFYFETPQQVLVKIRECALSVESGFPESCDRALQATSRYDFYADEEVQNEIYFLLMRLIVRGHRPAYERAFNKVCTYHRYNDVRYDWVTEGLFLLVRAGYEPAFECALHRIKDVVRDGRGSLASVKYALMMAGILLEKRSSEMVELNNEILEWLPSLRVIDQEDIRAGDLSYCASLAYSFSQEKDRAFLFSTIQHYCDRFPLTFFENIMILRVVNNMLVRGMFEDYEWLYHFVKDICAKDVFASLRMFDDKRREDVYGELLYSLSFLIQQTQTYSHFKACYLTVGVIMEVKDLYKEKMVRKDLLVDAFWLMNRLVQEDFVNDVVLKRYVSFSAETLVGLYIHDADPDIKKAAGALAYALHAPNIQDFIKEDQLLMDESSDMIVPSQGA